mmetsp:Transcript_60864/g.162860  ORF Transcript_60864/g.162860 Transcript_60864/m.162860 type:complete len:278 (+) Transcript_60864:5690-6523(+)
MAASGRPSPGGRSSATACARASRPSTTWAAGGAGCCACPTPRVPWTPCGRAPSSTSRRCCGGSRRWRARGAWTCGGWRTATTTRARACSSCRSGPATWDSSPTSSTASGAWAGPTSRRPSRRRCRQPTATPAGPPVSCSSATRPRTRRGRGGRSQTTGGVSWRRTGRRNARIWRERTSHSTHSRSAPTQRRRRSSTRWRARRAACRCPSSPPTTCSTPSASRPSTRWAGWTWRTSTARSTWATPSPPRPPLPRPCAPGPPSPGRRPRCRRGDRRAPP